MLTLRRSVWPAAAAVSVTVQAPGAVAVHSVEAAPELAKVPHPGGVAVQAKVIPATGPPRASSGIRSPTTTELRGATMVVTMARSKVGDVAAIVASTATGYPQAAAMVTTVSPISEPAASNASILTACGPGLTAIAPYHSPA